MSFVYDRYEDPHRHNPDPHWRLIADRHGNPAVACLQDFDYFDYREEQFLSADAYNSEGEAQAGLVIYLQQKLGEAVEASQAVPRLLAQLDAARRDAAA